MKCKNTILNEMMLNAAELIAIKIEHEKIVLQQFKAEGDSERIIRLE